MLHVTQVSGVCGPPSDDVHRQGLLFHGHRWPNDGTIQMDSIKPDESEQKVVMSVLRLLEEKNADLAVRR